MLLEVHIQPQQEDHALEVHIQPQQEDHALRGTYSIQPQPEDHALRGTYPASTGGSCSQRYISSLNRRIMLLEVYLQPQ
jgi:hypothetical protein